MEHGEAFDKEFLKRLKGECNMRILFVNCVNYLDASLPEGIALLITILKKKGHEVRLFDTAFLKPKSYTARSYENAKRNLYKTTAYNLHDLVQKDPELDIAQEFSKTINEFEPSLIAVSCMTTNYERALDLIRKVKPNCKVVFGGVHPTLMPEDVIGQPEIDLVCVGEGDDALVELCDLMEKGIDYRTIRNFYIRGNQGEIVRNELRPFVDLDTLPPLDLGLFDERYFFRPFSGNIYKGIFMSTSRGCPRGCHYCVNNRLKDIFRECGKKYTRFQSPDIAVRNIKHLKDTYGINWFRFSDDTFLLRPLKDIEKMADLLAPLGIQIGCSVDPATATKEKILAAKKMGCVSMSMGIETGNEQIRKKILGRFISDNQIKKAASIVRDCGIKVSTFNIIGLPGETRENVFETIRLNREIGVPDATVYILYPFPGTKIYNDSGISFFGSKTIPEMSEAHVFNLSKILTDDLLFLFKAFKLYLVLPESRWAAIGRAQNDKELWSELEEEAQRIADNPNYK